MKNNPIIDFQNKIGVIPDGDFGPKSAKALVVFLKLNPVAGAHFIGQCWHESAGFSIVEENLNYSQGGLLKIFGKYFTTKEQKIKDRSQGKANLKMLASEYANKPKEIANVVYANRMGNGSTQSGDGYRFRGRGVIQLTGRNNYSAFSQRIGNPLILVSPDLVASEFALESAKFFFEENNIFKVCVDVKEQTIEKVSILINGGRNGLDDRIEQTLKAFRWITSR
jgi:putative chitinase